MMNAADIAVVNVDTGRHRVLTAQSGFSDEHPRYFTDGAHLAWHSYNLKRAFTTRASDAARSPSAARDDSRRASIARRPATAGLRMARRSIS